LALTRADERKSLDALQGKWTLVSTEIDGKAKNYPDRSIIFEGKEYRWYVKNLLVKTATVTLDPKATPPKMDLLHIEGPAQGKIAMCIYKIEGDRLTIADGLLNGGHPLEFDSTKPPCRSITVWKRAK